MKSSTDKVVADPWSTLFQTFNAYSCHSMFFLIVYRSLENVHFRKVPQSTTLMHLGDGIGGGRMQNDATKNSEVRQIVHNSISDNIMKILPLKASCIIPLGRISTFQKERPTVFIACHSSTCTANSNPTYAHVVFDAPIANAYLWWRYRRERSKEADALAKY